jgi:hypothetical protein
MKTCSAPNQPPRRDRSEAWGYFTANLALPGSGSLAAGRKIGYAQMTISFAGLGLTMIGGVPFVYWALTNWGRLMQDVDPFDPFDHLLEMWKHAQWPLLGIALFILALLWAMSTSLSLLAANKQSTLPPKLTKK